MRSRAELRVAAPARGNGRGDRCRISWAKDAPPIAFRETPEAVYLVGTAAFPVSDDQVSLEVHVGSGATLRLRSAASQVAWTSTGATFFIDAFVQAGGCLDWHLQPLLSTAGCNFSQRAIVRLENGATLRWREEIMLGRHLEEPGRLDLRLDVDTDGAPLLRHQLGVGPGSPGWDGPAVLGQNRAVGFVLLAGDDEHTASTACDAWAAMPLDGPGVLLQAVAPDVPALREALALADRTRSSPL